MDWRARAGHYLRARGWSRPARVQPWSKERHAGLAGRAVPLGATYDGMGTNFAIFSEVAEKIELCLFDEWDTGAERDRAARGRRVRVARIPAGHRAGPALRLPGARSVRPGERPALQPEQAADRPVREGHRR
ncbi:hypothetical protein NKG94_12670 [Micromonospora sp. M12]